MVRKGKQEYMIIDLDRGIEFYLSTLETEGKSPAYIDWLNKRLGYFLEYIQETYGRITQVQELSVEDGRNFLRSLMKRKMKYQDHPMHKPKPGGLKVQYIHGCGRAVRSFSTWAYEEGYLDENIMRRLRLPKLPQTQPKPLSEEEIQMVLAACFDLTREPLRNYLDENVMRRLRLPKLPQTQPKPLSEEEIQMVLAACFDLTREPLRNYAIMMLFLDTGIRLGELINLKISDIDFTASQMAIFGKGAKERIVPIGRQAKKALIEYLSRERPGAYSPKAEAQVFLTSDGLAMTSTAVQKLFQRVKRETGISKFHPHMCRHTFAIRYLMNGGDAFSLQRILGHASLDMTRKYVNLAAGDLKEKHRQYSPMDNLNVGPRRRGRPKIRN
jgi:site-specific recombinase XerD